MTESMTEIRNQHNPMIINMIIRNKEKGIKAELKAQYIDNITDEREKVFCASLVLKSGSIIGTE